MTTTEKLTRDLNNGDTPVCGIGAAAHVLRELAPLVREVATCDHRWLTTRLRPYRAVDDRIDGLVVTFVDVTDRLRSEEALRQTRDLLTRAAEASGLGWATCDLATGRARWDERSRALIGLEADDTTLAPWLARVHPDDRPQVEAVFEECARTGATFDLSYRVVHRDGAVRCVRATGVFPRDREGATRRASALLRDVTEPEDPGRG